MKEMNELLQAMIADGLELNNFYCISLHDNDIKLQGRFNSTLIKKYTLAGFSVQIEPVNGYVEMNKDKINITLTD